MLTVEGERHGLWARRAELVQVEVAGVASVSEANAVAAAPLQRNPALPVSTKTRGCFLWASWTITLGIMDGCLLENGARDGVEPSQMCVTYK
jgi:hypothetical protein